MAMSSYTQQALAAALGSQASAAAIVGIVNADGGTLNVAHKERLVQAMCSRAAATQFVTELNADDALTDPVPHVLRHCIGTEAFKEIDADQGEV